jgi:hypothetical protein
MSYERIENGEPAILVAVLTALVGFAVLVGVDVDAMQSAATALGIAGAQGAITRQGVYSPKSVAALKASNGMEIPLGEMLANTAGGARRQEPALAVGAATLLGGFLVQFFAGVGLTEALVSATGIAGAQGVATRGRVYSPASAQRIAVSRLLAEMPPEDVQAVFETAGGTGGAETKADPGHGRPKGLFREMLAAALEAAAKRIRTS